MSKIALKVPVKKALPIPKKLIQLSVISSISLLSWIAYLAGSIYFYGTQTTQKQADAAIVLGAAVWDTEPSPVFQERINHAIHLYQTQQVDRIIFTGASGELHENPESIVAKNYAIDKGIPESKILVETSSKTTFQNLYYAKEVSKKQQIQTFLIVSDPLHLKRALMMAQDLDMTAYPSPTPTTRYKSLETQREFLQRETLFYGLYLILRRIEEPAQNPSKF
jgi:uncharacterized SAM-binding protein YcdF (DUF218 family)